MRILVADDEEAVRATLSELCRSLGHQVVAEAANGREAVECADRALPDLALLDIMMPEMSGTTAAHLITHRWHVPVLIVTGHSEESLVREAAERGALSYVLKPLTRERLHASITMAMARSSDLKGLRDEVVDLRQNLENRKLVERAKGILMGDMKVGEQEAFSWLKMTSRHRSVELTEVARRVVALDGGKGRR